MKLIIDAGHYIGDKNRTALYGDFTETDLTIKIRDALKPLLADRQVLCIPDLLNLKESITFVNERATAGDFAVSIHLNAYTDSRTRGTEAYYWTDPRYAEVFAREVAEHLLVPNRGAKPDSQTYYGELGWLRRLNCPSVLVECLYLTNELDRNALFVPDGIEAAARGIASAINILFPQPKEDKSL